MLCYGWNGDSSVKYADQVCILGCCCTRDQLGVSFTLSAEFEGFNRQSPPL